MEDVLDVKRMTMIFESQEDELNVLDAMKKMSQI